MVLQQTELGVVRHEYPTRQRGHEHHTSLNILRSRHDMYHVGLGEEMTAENLFQTTRTGCGWLWRQRWVFPSVWLFVRDCVYAVTAHPRMHKYFKVWGVFSLFLPASPGKCSKLDRRGA